MVQSSSVSTVAPRAQVPAQSEVEETLNQVTHGIGFVLSVAGSIALLSRSMTDMAVYAGCWVYAISMMALFLASTLSHTFETEPRRSRWRMLDQVLIFVFMAGIYTPVGLRVCNDGWWHLPLILMWVMTGVGTWLKIRVAKEEMVSVWFYMLLGAIPMAAFGRMLSEIGTRGVLWMLAAACCYLVGILFLTNDHRRRFFHPIWHVCVILGSICHYVMISEFTIR